MRTGHFNLGTEEGKKAADIEKGNFSGKNQE